MSEKKYNKLTDAQREIVEEAMRYRDMMGMTDAQFARDILPFSDSVWLRLRTDKYTGLVEKNIGLLQARLNELRSMEVQRRIYEDPDGEWFELPPHRAVLKALDRAVNAKTQNRLVIFAAATGGGKSALCGHVAMKYDSRVIEGRESWRKSGKEFCRDVCRAFNSPCNFHTSGQAELGMLTALQRSERNVLIVDESNYFGTPSINEVKLALNRGNTAVLLCGIPSIMRKMVSSSYAEASQLLRRSQWIEYNKIEADEVRPFLACLELTGIEKAACVIVASGATDFGLFDTVKRIREHLIPIDAKRKLTIDDIRSAVTFVHKSLGFRGSRRAK